MEHMTVTGLTSGSTYYFAVRAQDEIPNTSDLSNSHNCQAALDTIAPAAITNLSGTSGTNEGTVNLTWTAPGDNGNLGTATIYLVRYSTSIIDTDAKWNSATAVSTGIPTPHAAGTTENMTVSGLTSGTPYFFAVETQDEVPNTSPLSNSPSIQAAADTIAPAAITDLAATTGTNAG